MGNGNYLVFGLITNKGIGKTSGPLITDAVGATFKTWKTGRLARRARRQKSLRIGVICTVLVIGGCTGATQSPVVPAQPGRTQSARSTSMVSSTPQSTDGIPAASQSVEPNPSVSMSGSGEPPSWTPRPGKGGAVITVAKADGGPLNDVVHFLTIDGLCCLGTFEHDDGDPSTIELSALDPGVVVVNISADGYAQVRTTLDVQPGRIVSVSATLVRDPKFSPPPFTTLHVMTGEIQTILTVEEALKLPDHSVASIRGQVIWEQYPTGFVALCTSTYTSSPPGCESRVIRVADLAPNQIPPTSVGPGDVAHVADIVLSGRLDKP